MYTIKTSFKRLESVAFATDGRLAVLGGGGSSMPSPLVDTDWQSRIAALAPLSGAGWNCEVWSLPPNPAKVWRDWDGEPYAFGLAFDPRTGHLMHGDAKEGLLATNPTDRLGLEVPGGPLRVFAISPSGDRLVCGCELWNGRTPKQSVAAQLVSFTRGGKQKHWTRCAALEGDGFVFSEVAFFANGKRFASIEWSKRKQGREYHVGDVPTLRVHDSKSLDELDETTCQEPAKDLVVCDASLVVRGEKSFRVWDADELAADPVEVKTGRAALSAIAADTRGRFVLTATGDSVSVRDSNSWSATKTYEWASGKITCLAVSPDGLLAAAGTATGKVIVWDAE
ncbi:MAG: hypothetical protein K8U57_01405 [Planctomycetes bacterium]|nr:hypothetical protein [Planctomycetota bacterium]